MCCTNKRRNTVGKKKNIIHGISHHYGEYTIKRDQFAEAIEAGISAVQDVHPDYPLPVEALREKAKYATEMDACTWKCKDSCGCPMTNAGVVTVIDAAVTHMTDPIDGAPSAFACAYDDKVLSFLIGDDDIVDDAIKLNIVG